MPRSCASTRACGLISWAEDATDRGQQGITVEQLQVARQLLHAVYVAATFDLDGDAASAGVPAEQVDRSDRGGELTPDEAPARSERLDLSGEQLLQMCLD